MGAVVVQYCILDVYLLIQGVEMGGIARYRGVLGAVDKKVLWLVDRDDRRQKLRLSFLGFGILHTHSKFAEYLCIPKFGLSVARAKVLHLLCSPTPLFTSVLSML